MSLKLSILTTAFIALILIDGCQKCEQIAGYYDFQTLDISYPAGMSISDGPFDIEIFESDIEYLASNTLGLLAPAMATKKCAEPGEYGLKYLISELSITSNADWDVLHPAGSSLNDVMLYGEFNLTDIEYTKKASEITVFPNDNIGIYLRLSTKPSTLNHVFTITLEKSNGDIVSVQTNEITWLD